MSTVASIQAGQRAFRILAVLLLFLIVTSCKPGVDSPHPTGSPTGTPAGSALAPPPVFTATPTDPPPAPVAVLILPAGIDPSEAAEWRAVVGDLAASSGLEMEEAGSVLPSGIHPAWKVVVAAASPGYELDPSWSAAVQAHPETRFILAAGTLSSDTSPAGVNQTTITPADEPQAFLAGYIAALASHEWRVGILSRGDTPEAIARREAFLNGVRYLCGVCNPKYPPYVDYPVYAEATSSTDWEAGVEVLAQQGVNTVYVEPSMQSQELLAVLFGKGMNLVGGISPVFSPEEITPETSGRWIATVRQDSLATLRDTWEVIMSGGEAEVRSAALVVQDRNPDLLSDARLRLVEETRQALEGGWILPSSIPPQ